MGKRRFQTVIVNTGILFTLILALYLAYTVVMRTFVRPPVEPVRYDSELGEVIQLEVLNGCGVEGIAGLFTEYLRARGYDVVDIGNYKTFDLQETIVLDRTGVTENAKRVAYALGVKESNVIEDINLDYLLDVTLIIGHDYQTLKPKR